MREGGKILIYGHHLLLLMEVVAGGDAHVGRPMPLHACLLESMLIVQARRLHVLILVHANATRILCTSRTGNGLHALVLKVPPAPQNCQPYH